MVDDGQGDCATWESLGAGLVSSIPGCVCVKTACLHTVLEQCLLTIKSVLQSSFYSEMASDSLTFVSAQCYCSANTFKVAFRTDSLPVACNSCHCSTCRHSTGTLSTRTVPILGSPLALDAEPQTPFDLSHLKTYSVSGHLQRYFCGTCGAYLFLRSSETWTVFAGALDKNEGITRLVSHSYVGDTLDGGLANHLGAWDGVGLPLFAGAATEMDQGDFQLAEVPSAPVSTVDNIPFQCSCGDISFAVKRYMGHPDQQEIWLVPGATEDDPWRYRVGHCLCNDCRLNSGGLITTFTFVPVDHLVDGRTSEPIGQSRPQGLVTFESSPGVFREFCGTCGARVFYWTNSMKGHTRGVAFGLLDERAVGGALGRALFAFHPHPIYAELTADPKMSLVPV